MRFDSAPGHASNINEREHMRTMIIGASAGFVLGWGAVLGGVAAASNDGVGDTATFYGSEYAMDEPTMTQVEFLQYCAEDEVLGFAPEFGPDHVGCVHVDSI